MNCKTVSDTLTRPVSRAEYCHELLGDTFEAALSEYDTQRRVELLIDDFLAGDMLVGKRVLDVGCGLGFFSRQLVQRGADVVACDIGASLVETTRRRAGCRGEVADALNLVNHFGPASWDGVVSSECIEHTPHPAAAIEQMLGVVRPGGFLALSTPNRVWYPVVKLATLCKLRPFDGYENFSTWRSLRTAIENAGGEVVREVGLHLFPFQLPLHGVSRWCDCHLQRLRPLMINLCVLARRV